MINIDLHANTLEDKASANQATSKRTTKRER